MSDASPSQISVFRQSPLQEAWIEFLGRYAFEWFCTFTFVEVTHPESAYKRFLWFVNQLNCRLYGRNWRRNPYGGVYWVNALEYQRRGVVHFHSLLGAPGDLNAMARRYEWKRFWCEIAGIARIERIDSAVNVTAYVSKYVVKGGELDLSRSLAAYVQQARMQLDTPQR